MCEMTLDLGNDYRANVVHDPHAEKPDIDSGAPVVSISDGWVYNFDASDDKYADYVRNFVSHFGNDWGLLERALKIVFDCTTVYQVDTRYATYFCFDPEENCGTYAKHIRANIVNDTAKEYEAYANGECYGVVVEERITGRKVFDNGSSDEVFEEWQEIDSVWGFYGDWILDDDNLREVALDFVPAEN